MQVLIKGEVSVGAGVIRHCLPLQYLLPHFCTYICYLCPEGPTCSCWIVAGGSDG